MKVINILINKKRLLQKKKKSIFWLFCKNCVIILGFGIMEMIKYGNVKVFIEVNLYLTQYHFICKNISSQLPRSLIF